MPAPGLSFLDVGSMILGFAGYGFKVFRVLRVLPHSQRFGYFGLLVGSGGSRV